MKTVTYKLFFVLAILLVFAAKCKKEQPIITFDYVAQEEKDRAALEEYLTTHYLDAENNIQEISDGETPLMDQVLTKTVSITKDYYNDEIDGEVTIDYTLYYLITEEGVGINPKHTDSVNFSFKGMTLDNEVFGEENYGMWAGILDSGDVFGEGLIIGMNRGLLEFKSGTWTTNLDGSISLNLVKQETDWDHDGIDSMYEDVDGNGILTDDDTDGDNILNFADSDDDGDGKLTKDEHPDPNGDGNPEDAQDSDGDGTPDYLDADS
ncbi:MAG: hypothetical protein CR968_04670 [Flavobacteriia bacterium]|nr:MAG: hypothetical protein CR968_04670 [Flavobacteriia bacterium]